MYKRIQLLFNNASRGLHSIRQFIDEVMQYVKVNYYM